ncbi:MAG: DUF432 domain-containing protein [Staphylothermus sp.]|nr:DUF432 domain-containing protein [Staphylothermus sp.]
MVYGVLDRGRFVVGDYVLVIEKFGKGLRYRRLLGERVVFDSFIVGASRLVLVPIYPVLVPKKITRFVLVEYSGFVDVGPGHSVSFYIYVPVDFAVYSYGSRGYSVVDVFEGVNPKYAVYGPILGLERGEAIIARYYRSEIYYEDPGPRPGLAVTRVHVVNNTDSWARVSKILIDSNIATLYYEPGSWKTCLQELRVNINSPTTATVKYGEPLYKELKRIDDPKDLKPPKIGSSTEMLWGL